MRCRLRRVVGPALLVGVAALLVAAWWGTEWLGFDASLPVLVGEVPRSGSIADAVGRAGLLIVARLAVVVIAPAAVLAAVLDLAMMTLGSALSRSSSEPGDEGRGKGPTPEPVGSTGGGL